MNENESTHPEAERDEEPVDWSKRLFGKYLVGLILVVLLAVAFVVGFLWFVLDQFTNGFGK